MIRTSRMRNLRALISASLMAASSVAYASTYLKTCIKTSGEPSLKMGAFYGYSSSNSGPGDEAFEKCRRLAEENAKPLVVVYGKDSCSTCDRFASEVNNSEIAMSIALGHIDGIKGYFRGKNDGTGPVACVAARAFFDKLARIDSMHAAVPGSCHLVCYYRIFPDGCQFARSAVMSGVTSQFKPQIDMWSSEYEKELPSHHHDNVVSSSAFLHEKQDLSKGVTTFYVPLVRTNCLNKVETNALKVVAGDNTTTKTNFVWQKNCERLELPLSFAGDTNTNWKLILVNTNGMEVATNLLTRSDAVLTNSFTNPRFIGEVTNKYDFGEWTLDLAAATGGVWAANSYKQSDTGKVHVVNVPGYPRDFDWSTSNRYDTVYTNDYKFFASEDKGEGHGPEGARKWTEEDTWQFTFAATNLETTIFTNDFELFADKVATKDYPQSRTFETTRLLTTNFVHVLPEVTMTNVVAKQNFDYCVTNSIRYVIENGMTNVWGAVATNNLTATIPWTNEVRTVLAPESSVMVDADVHEKSVGALYTNVFYVADAQIEFTNDWNFATTNTVTTNYVESVAEIKGVVTNEVPVLFSSLATNRLAYIVSPDRTMTNFSGKAETTAVEVLFNVTNFIYTALTNDNQKTVGSFTNDLEILTNTVTSVGTNAFFRTEEVEISDHWLFAVTNTVTTNAVNVLPVPSVADFVATNAFPYAVVTNRPAYVVSGSETNRVVDPLCEERTEKLAWTNHTVWVLTILPTPTTNQVATISNQVSYDDGKRRTLEIVTPEVPFDQTWTFATTNTVTTNYVESVGASKDTLEIMTNKFDCLVTNLCQHIVSPDGTATNSWGEAITTNCTFSFFSTNWVYYVETNDTHHTIGESTINVFEVLTNTVTAVGTNIYQTTSAQAAPIYTAWFSTNYPSALDYTVNFDVSPAETNLVWSNKVEKVDAYSIDWTDYITYVWSSGTTSKTSKPLAPLVSGSFSEPYTNYYYDVTWDAEPTNWVDQSKSYCETNRVYYVFNGSTTTNECEAEQTVISTNMSYIATNYAHWVYSATNGIYTEYKDCSTNKFTVLLTNTYTRVETNDYQYGYNDKKFYDDPDFKERHGKSTTTTIQAFTLAVSGCSTTDEKLKAFAEQVFATANFTTWVTDRNIALVLLDCTNSVAKSSATTGLLTHNHSGASCYISHKGLRAYAETEPAEGDTVGLSAEEMQAQLDAWNADYRKAATNEMEIILIRPDGSVVGRLAPQMKDGMCDLNENMQRLEDLLALADDKTEELNDDPITTELEVEYGKDYDIEKDMTEDELRKLRAEKMQTLMMSDKIDVFSIKDVKADTPFIVTNKHWHLSSVTPETAIYAWNDAEKQSYTQLKDTLASGVYVATSEQVANGLFLTEVVLTNEAAKTSTEYKDRTWCYYVPEVLAAPEVKGTIGISGELNETCLVAGEHKCVIEVYRTGYTGEATATVRLDTASTQVPQECFSWVNENGATNLTWAANESGKQSITVSVHNVTWLLDSSNLVFTVEATGAKLDESASKKAFAVSQEVDPDAPTGHIRLSAPVCEETIYVFGGSRDPLTLTLEREKSWYEERGIWVARGAATGTVTAAGCSFDPSEKIEWGAYSSGAQNVTVTFPSLENKASSKTITVSVAGKDCDGTDITVSGSNSVTVCILPEDSCDFLQDVVINDAVQYVALEPKYALLRDWSDNFKLVSVSKISGALPPGISVKLFAEESNHGFIVTGTPTTPGDYEALYWMKLRRSNGTTMMTKPCKICIKVKSLAKTEENPDGLIPGFDEARTWTGLLVVGETNRRLAGLLDMTVRKNGSTTAKWRKAGGKTVSFSASSLSGATQEEGVTNVYATALKMQSKIMNEFNVVFADDGAIDGWLVSEGVTNEFAVPAAEVWSKYHTADDWAGNYTLAFPHDGEWNANTHCNGPITLRVKANTNNKTGRVTFAGTLPNGLNASGSATFVPATNDAETATLPIFYSTSADTLGAAVDVSSTTNEVFASDLATNFWQHVERGIAEESYDNDYYVGGMRYAASDWAALYKTNEFKFAIDGVDRGASVKVSGKSFKVVDKGVLKSFAFAFKNTYGYAQGSFRDGTVEKPFANGKLASWRGVAVGYDDVFLLGSYSYCTNVCYGTTNRSVRVGGEIRLCPCPSQGE